MVIETILPIMTLKEIKKILIVGGGGHAVSCIDLLSNNINYTISGYIDINQNDSLKLKYLGNEEQLEIIKKDYDYALIAIGQIKNLKIREEKYFLLKSFGFKLPNILSNISYLSNNIIIGDSNSIFHNVIINSSSIIGNNNIFNTRSLIEHEVIIGNNNHISTGVIINGSSKIGNNNFIGSGVVINNNLSIGNNCIIGSSVNIKKNVKDYEIIK